MGRCRGFTLIETLITTLVLVTGLAAIAGLFSYGAKAGTENRHRIAATALLQTKMEELRHAPNLEPGQYAETVPHGPASYMTTWVIENGFPRRITVIVYGRDLRRKNAYAELVRSTYLAGRGF
jgi:prepilin-type N-terminal cleavage/methylation domain-containing protein